MNELWAVPPWVVLWPGRNGGHLFNPLNMEILWLDNDAVAACDRLRTKSPFDRATAAAEGLGATELALLAGVGCIVPPPAAEPAHLRAAVAAARAEEAARAQQRRIGAARLVLTHGCNLACDYCFVPTKAAEQMSLATALAACTMLVAASGGEIEHLQFFGGEPLLRLDLIRAVVARLEQERQQGRLRKVGYALTTNGTMVTAATADFLAQHGFVVDVSLDGLPQVHDRHRRLPAGGGTYALAERGLRLLQEQNVDVGVLITPTAANVAGLAEFVRYVHTELGVTSIAVNTPQPGPAGWPVDGRQLAAAVVAATHYAAAAGISFASAAARVIAAVDRRRPYYFSCLRGSGALGVAISPQGWISPCDVAWDAELAVGAIDPAADPAADPAPAGVGGLALSRWKLTPHRIPAECLQCYALPTCGGPCPLDLYYNPDDARTNRARCDFFRAVTQWAVCRLPVRT